MLPHRPPAAVSSSTDTLALWMEQSFARMHRGLLVVREELLQSVRSAEHEQLTGAALLKAKLQSSVDAWSELCASMAEGLNAARASVVQQADERSQHVLRLISNISEEAMLASESTKQRCMMETLDDQAMSLRTHAQAQFLQAERDASAAVAQRLALEQQRLRDGWLQLQEAAQSLASQKAKVVEREQLLERQWHALRERDASGKCHLHDVASAITRLHVDGHGWIEDVDRQRRLVVVSGAMLTDLSILLTSAEALAMGAAGHTSGAIVVADGPMLANPVRGGVEAKGCITIPRLNVIDGIQGPMDLFVAVFPTTNTSSDVFSFASPPPPILFRIPLRVLSVPSASLQRTSAAAAAAAVRNGSATDGTTVVFDLRPQDAAQSSLDVVPYAAAAYQQQWTLTAGESAPPETHEGGDAEGRIVVPPPPQCAWAPVALESSDDGRNVLSVVFDVSSPSAVEQQHDGRAQNAPPPGVLLYSLSLKLAGVARKFFVWEGHLNESVLTAAATEHHLLEAPSVVATKEAAAAAADEEGEPTTASQSEVTSVEVLPCSPLQQEQQPQDRIRSPVDVLLEQQLQPPAAASVYRTFPNGFHNTQIVQNTITGALYELPLATVVTDDIAVAVEKTGARLPVSCTGPVCVWLPDGSEVVCLVLATSRSEGERDSVAPHAPAGSRGCGGGAGAVSVDEDVADIIVYSLDEREVVASLYLPPLSTTPMARIGRGEEAPPLRLDEIQRFLPPREPSTDLLAVSDRVLYCLSVGELWAVQSVYCCDSNDVEMQHDDANVVIRDVEVMDGADRVVLTLSNGTVRDLCIGEATAATGTA